MGLCGFRSPFPIRSIDKQQLYSLLYFWVFFRSGVIRLWQSIKMKSLFRVRWLFIASSESTLNTRKREHKIPLLFDFYFNTKIWRDHKNREKTKSESFSGAFNFDKDRIDQNISIVRCSYFIWEMLQMLIYCSKWTENAELGMIA